MGCPRDYATRLTSQPPACTKLSSHSLGRAHSPLTCPLMRRFQWRLSNNVFTRVYRLQRVSKSGKGKHTKWQGRCCAQPFDGFACSSAVPPASYRVVFVSSRHPCLKDDHGHPANPISCVPSPATSQTPPSQLSSLSSPSRVSKESECCLGSLYLVVGFGGLCVASGDGFAHLKKVEVLNLNRQGVDMWAACKISSESASEGCRDSVESGKSTRRSQILVSSAEGAPFEPMMNGRS